MPRARWPKAGDVYQCRHVDGKLYRFAIRNVYRGAVVFRRSIRGRHSWEDNPDYYCEMRPAVFRRQAKEGGLKLCRA